MLLTQWGKGVVKFTDKKHYEGVMFNVISIMRVWCQINNTCIIIII